MVAEHTYRYLHESSYSVDGGLGLATAGGRHEHPYFFRGFIERADQAARALLVVSEVSRTRYFDASVALRMRDPVVTSNRSVVRFESFSVCHGVYARFDLDADGFDSEYLDWGTTNVDVNEPLRAALSAVAAGDPMRLSVGNGEIAGETRDGATVERKVPLPDRWLKGFAEVQIASAGMVQVAELSAIAARASIRDLGTKKMGNQRSWVSLPSSGARLSQRPTALSPSLVGPQRLGSLRRVLPYVRGLRVFTTVLDAGRGPLDVLRPSAWVADLDSARLTLVISPELHRGFSGEGAVLNALAAADRSAVATVGEALSGQARLDSEALSAKAAVALPAINDALQVLGAAGRVGHDVAANAFFHRDLPFDRTTLTQMQPRLIAAKDLVDQGAVQLAALSAIVKSGETGHTVRENEGSWRCTCAWYAKHRGERGPCEHVLAVQLARVRSDEADAESSEEILITLSEKEQRVTGPSTLPVSGAPQLRPGNTTGPR